MDFKFTWYGHATLGLETGGYRLLIEIARRLQGVLRAGVADLEQVEGIGPTMARTLYDQLHPGE